MADTEWVELKHPKVEGTYNAPASALEHYKSNGWSEVSKAEQRKAEQGKADS